MEYDVIVIGSGAGGGMAGYAFAEAGKTVLMLERGATISNPSQAGDEQKMVVEMLPYDDRSLWVNKKQSRLFVSGSAGGGTSLYGAMLMRPAREDFHPGKFYSGYLDKSIWDWPIQYEDLKPFYDHAEKLMGISTTGINNLLYVEKPVSFTPNVLALKEANTRLKNAIEEHGFHPYHLPLAIDFSQCLDCPSCPGYLCPNDARGSVLNRLLNKPAIRKQIMFKQNSEVERLFVDHRTIHGVFIKGKPKPYTAKKVILAAGSISTPLILMKSGLEDKSGQTGKNFMYHSGALVSGIFKQDTGTATSFVKQLGFNDLYFGSVKFKHKLGYAQEIPIPGPLTIQNKLPFPVPGTFARWIHRKSLSIAGVVEDLPQATNRIELSAQGNITINHKFHAYDNYRAAYFKKQLAKIIRKMNPRFMVGGTFKYDHQHTAHQVGTARFGSHPQHAVLDKNCKPFKYDNLYITDGSFMPSSMGAPPALTIMANALRVSRHILEDL